MVDVYRIWLPIKQPSIAASAAMPKVCHSSEDQGNMCHVARPCCTRVNDYCRD